jgi:hypothetical protein
MKRKGKHNTNQTIRQPCSGAKRFDASCRNHGGCSWCLGNRLHSRRVQEQAADEKLAEFREEPSDLDSRGGVCDNAANPAIGEPCRISSVSTGIR